MIENKSTVIPSGLETPREIFWGTPRSRDAPKQLFHVAVTQLDQSVSSHLQGVENHVDHIVHIGDVHKAVAIIVGTNQADVTSIVEDIADYRVHICDVNKAVVIHVTKSISVLGFSNPPDNDVIALQADGYLIVASDEHMDIREVVPTPTQRQLLAELVIGQIERPLTVNLWTETVEINVIPATQLVVRI